MRIVLFLLLFTIPSFSQSAEPAQESRESGQESPGPAGNPAPRRRIHETPCWRVAGLTANMVNQRWKIEEDAKEKIAAACDDESTNAQQKHEKIEQINAARDVALSNIIPSKELKALNACQAEREKSHPKPAGRKQLGPCGGVIPRPEDATTPEQSDHHDMKAPTR